MSTVPAIRIEDLSEAQLRAYTIADNKIAENAEWDFELLATELQYLNDLDIDFDLTLTGFETAEIDRLISFPDTADADPQADHLPEIDPDRPPVTQTGDLWILGRNRLLCGDAREKTSFDRLMDGRRAQMVITDPPYNVRVPGHVCGRGRIRHRDFPMASGEMSETEYVDFLKNVITHLIESTTNGSIHYIFIDWRHLYQLMTAAKPYYTEAKNLIVWTKTNAGLGTFYRSQHELILALKNGRRSHVNNFELGQHGRHRSNVWTYPGVNTFKSERLEELAMHPTVKPVALVADAMVDCSKRGGIVLDPFSGSGTAIIAAEKTGRKACAMELDPIHVDTAIRRWSDYTSGEAVHAETGCRFSELEGAREHD